MTEKLSSQNTLSRRGLLKLLAAAGVISLGGHLLSEYAPWLNYDQEANDTWGSFDKKWPPAAQIVDVVRLATLAANGHNTQPWKFLVKENVIEIHPDYSRRLPAVDPDDRELWISLGCALENLLIASRVAGYAPEVTYPDPTESIHVHLAIDTPQSDPLFEAIPRRQSTRSEYDGQLIKTDDLDQVQALPLEPGVVLHFIPNQTDLETVLEYVNQGNLSQYADKAFVDELIYWLRFNKKEALASRDGLYSRCSGNPEVPRWLGKIFVAGANPQQQADTDAQKLRSSAGAVVIASESDGRTNWVRIGQVCERLMLKMTSLNIKSAFLNQPIEAAHLRSQFQSAIGLGTSLPQLLLRFGYANPMPRSLRRFVDQVTG